jgi:hypothetical protein
MEITITIMDPAAPMSVFIIVIVLLTFIRATEHREAKFPPRRPSARESMQRNRRLWRKEPPSLIFRFPRTCLVLSRSSFQAVRAAEANNWLGAETVLLRGAVQKQKAAVMDRRSRSVVPKIISAARE